MGPRYFSKQTEAGWTVVCRRNGEEKEIGTFCRDRNAANSCALQLEQAYEDGLQDGLANSGIEFPELSEGKLQ